MRRAMNLRSYYTNFRMILERLRKGLNGSLLWRIALFSVAPLTVETASVSGRISKA